MPETLLPTTIRARVHEDAISRVTRFFNATTVETLNELFQNARRAGATRVDVTIADGEVRVADDGEGIARPAALLAFGQSRWDADTARREDPAGMGVYALARRPKVTIRSRPRPADGHRLPAWEVHLTPEHFLGKRDAAVSIIDAATLPFGTEIVFDDDKANTGSVDIAAEHFPLPVTCNGSDVRRRDFLHDAIHIEHWRGIRLGVRSVSHHPGRGPELNFHGIRIENVRLPVIASMESHWYVKADVVDCAELELMLPARKAIVETRFVEQLRNACRTAIYRAMLKVDNQISVPAEVRADALSHGVDLPIARAELARWWPTYANEYSTKREDPHRTPLPDRPIVVEADIPACDQVALWRAARRSDISHRLCAEEPRYRGYSWYDSLPKVKKVTTRVVLQGVLDGEELSIEEQRTRHVPFHTARPERITFVLETIDGDGAVEHVCIPADVAFGDDEVSWPDDVGVLVTDKSDITPDELADLMYDAYFYPSDDGEADSYETQQDDYRQAAQSKALELLASAEEATLSNVRTAVHRWILQHLPRGSAAIIRIRRDKPIEITIEPAETENDTA